MARRGRPRKEISETMATIEDTIAAMMRLKRYCNYNIKRFGRPMDIKAAQIAEEILEKWRELRATEFQQGLRYEEEEHDRTK